MTTIEAITERAKALVLSGVKNVNWTRAQFITIFTENGSSTPNFKLLNQDSILLNYEFEEIFSLTRIFKSHFLSCKNDPINRFNKVSFEVFNTGETKLSLTWEDSEIVRQKAEWAKVLPQWVNDRLISILFSAGYGDETRWQRGVFIFTVKAGQLDFDGIIYDKDIPTAVQVELPNYLIEGILEHHQITNDGLLKDSWQPWNQLEIRSPHNDLDLDKDVTYRLI